MDQLHLSGSMVDLVRGEVHAPGGRVRLTSREVELLQYLALRPGQAVSRDELHTEVWNVSAAVRTRAVDFTLHRLRAKIERDPADPRHLLKVQGVGYKLVVDPVVTDTPTGAVTVLAGRIDRPALRWRQDPAGTDRAVNALRERMAAVAERLGPAVTVVRTHPPLAAFTTAADALAVARELVDHAVPELPLTIGLATGDVGWSRGAGPVELQGWTAERADVLARSFQPGHVVADEATAVALGTPLRDLGPVVPADLPERIRVFDAGPSPVRPEPNPMRVERTNVQRYAEPMFGRDAALAATVAEIDRGPITALWGPAGVGKTRLAREAALRWLDTPGRAAWFGDLRAATSADAVLVAAAEASGLPPDVLRAGRVLAQRGPTLVVLDNAERVAADAEALAVRWSEMAPEARFLITTRTRPGAVAVAVEVPPLDDAAGAALLVTRANVVRPGFGDQSPEVIAAIVRHLQAMPLALELVAARARLRTAPQLLAAITEAPEPGVVSAIGWSVLQLDPADREALEALSAFSSALTLEDAESLLGDDAIERVAALRDASLIVEVDDGRVALYEAVRSVAAGRLAADPDVERRVLARHASILLDRGEGLLRRFGGIGEPAALRTLTVDLPELLAIAERARVAGDVETRARTVAVVYPLLGRVGPRSLLRDLVEPLTASAERFVPSVAIALLRAAWMVFRGEGRTREAADALQRLVAIARRSGDEVEALLAEGRLAVTTEPLAACGARLAGMVDRLDGLGAPGPAGVLAIELGRMHVFARDLAGADVWNERALALQRRAGDRRGEAVVMTNQASLLRDRAAWAEATTRARAAHRILAETGDERNAATALGLLGTTIAGGGAPGEARPFLLRALSELRLAGMESEEVTVRGALVDVAILDGDPAGARAEATTALELARAIGQGWWADYQLALLACVRWMEGEREAALMDLERAIRQLERHTGVDWSWRATRAALLAAVGRTDEARGVLDSVGEVPAGAHSGGAIAAVRGWIEDGRLGPGEDWVLLRLRRLLAS